MQSTKNLSLTEIYLSNYHGISKLSWQSAFIVLTESSATGIIFFLSLYFTSFLNTSITIAGILIACYGIGTIFGSFIIGKLSDSFSGKSLATYSLLTQSAAFLALNYMHNIILLYIAMFTIGFCCYGFMASNNTWFLKQFDHNVEMRLKTINLNRAASNLGMAISGIIIGLLDIEQFHTISIISAFILLVTALYLKYSVAPNSVNANDIHNIQSTHDSANSTNSKKNQTILLILLCLFFISTIIAQLSTTYPIHIKEAFPNMGTKGVAGLFILDTCLIVLFQAPLVNHLQSFNKMRMIGVGALLMGLGMFILNLSISFYGAIISCIIWTTGEMIFIGLSHFLCYESGQDARKGQTIGILQATSATGKILGPVMGGYIYDIYGSYTLWTTCLIIGVSCFVLCHLFSSRDK